MSWLNEQADELLGRVSEAKSLGIYPYLHEFQRVGPRVWVDGKQYINFTSNDYLGLSQDPRLAAAAKRGVERYGTGLGSSRVQATTDRHVLLEERLAEWFGYPACAVFTTGYQSLVGLISAVVGPQTTVVLDNLSHACILDGTSMAQGLHGDEMETRFFRHNSVKGVRRILKKSQFEKRLLVVEGVYSLDGDTAPLDEFVALAKEYKTPIVVDDAHGMGTLGANGKGVIEHFNLTHQDVDFLVGTFSKSFGGIGGFVLGSKDLIDFLKNSARSFVFSASLPVPIVEAMLESLRIMSTDFSYMERLNANKEMMRAGLTTLGLDMGDSDTHITPIILRDETKTMEFGAWLRALGVIMIPILYPGVRHGEERLRCNITAAHTRQDIGMTLEVVEFVGKKLGVIPRHLRSTYSTTDRALWASQELVKRAKDLRPRHMRTAGKWLVQQTQRSWEAIAQGTVPPLSSEETMRLRQHFHKKNIIVTGGTSGIGKSIALQSAELGANVFLVARRQELLDETLEELERLRQHPEQVWEAFSLDVGEREAVTSTLRELGERHPPDFLVNSAGIAYANYLDETEPSVFEEMMRVNYLGTVWATQAVLPKMKERRRGHIINVSSLAGTIGIIGYAAYTPSKFAVMGFSDVLRNELKPHNIQVSVLVPGDTDTPQLAAENRYKPAETKALGGSAGLMSPEEVARATLRGVASGRYHIVPGMQSKMPYFASILMPGVTRWFLDREVLSFLRGKGAE